MLHSLSKSTDSDIQVLTSFLDRPGPTEVKQILSKLGVTHGETTLGCDSFIEYVPKTGEFIVGVNRALTSQKKRFAYAHCLAHYILHRDLLIKSDLHTHHDTFWKDDNAADPSPLTELHDRQANRLALQILMPYSKVKRLTKQGLGAAQLTKHFGVSEKAVQLLLETIA